MESYVLRIYRRDGEEGGDFVGTVEEAESGARMSFRTAEELLRLITGKGMNKDPLKGLKGKLGK